MERAQGTQSDRCKPLGITLTALCGLNNILGKGFLEDGRSAFGVKGVGAAKLAVILAGESPANRGCPVAVVVISSNGKGDRPVESLEVKAPGGRPEYRSDPYRGASNLAGRSECAN
jgi:hypothetical protein